MSRRRGPGRRGGTWNNAVAGGGAKAKPAARTFRGGARSSPRKKRQSHLNSPFSGGRGGGGAVRSLLSHNAQHKPMSMVGADRFAQRSEFIRALQRRLRQYGTPLGGIEAAAKRVRADLNIGRAHRLRSCQTSLWIARISKTSPTGKIDGLDPDTGLPPALDFRVLMGNIPGAGPPTKWTVRSQQALRKYLHAPSVGPDQEAQGVRPPQRRGLLNAYR